MQHEREDDADWYSEREYEETPDELENREVSDEVESAAKEAADDFDRQREIERIANEAAKEFDEYETKLKEIEDLAEVAAKEFDELQREKDMDGKEALEDDLENDLDEVREELHDEYINDMNRQLEGVSRKDGEVEAERDDSASSEATESSESYEDASTGMVYAVETRSESEGEVQSEVECEREAQEHTESGEPIDDVEESPDDQFRNKVLKQETLEFEQAENTPSDSVEDVEKQGIQRPESDVQPEAIESTTSKGEALQVNQPELEHEESREYTADDVLDSAEETNESEVKYDLEGTYEIEESFDALEEYNETGLDEQEHVIESTGSSDVESRSETESEEVIDDKQRGLESFQSEIEDFSEPEIDEKSEHEITESEDLPEKLEGFVRRVQDILEEKMDADDDYDYAQDSLTGEMQRVPKILVEYESEEERYRQRLRNLFAELSEEEREKFKEIVREEEESESKSFAEQVENLWTQVVEESEQNRSDIIGLNKSSEELLETLAEVFSFHSNQNMSEREIARKTGISRNQVRIALRDAEIHHRYYSEGQTFHQISTELNLTIYNLRLIFRKYGWEMRIQKERKRLSDAKIRKLHHEEGMTFFQISQYSGLDMPSVRKIIGVRKSKTRYEEIGRLYFQEGYSFEMISDILGVSMKTIRRAFKRNNWSFRKSTTTVYMDPDWVNHLYYVEGFSHYEVADILGVHSATIQKFFNDQGWRSRDTKQRKQIDIDEKRRKYQKRRRKKLKETRVEIFGNKCYACKTENTSKKSLHLHRKDGTEHDRNLFRSLKKLKSLKPKEWAPLCDRCHLGVHMLMSVYRYDWTKIEAFLKARSKESIKPKGVLGLPNDITPLSKQAQELDSSTTKNQLRRALFGESCSLCKCDGEVNSLILHRKDGMIHNPEMIDRKKYLQRLDPDKWALVCHDCHNIAQWALDKLGIEWTRLSKMLKQK